MAEKCCLSGREILDFRKSGWFPCLLGMIVLNCCKLIHPSIHSSHLCCFGFRCIRHLLVLMWQKAQSIIHHQYILPYLVFFCIILGFWLCEKIMICSSAKSLPFALCFYAQEIDVCLGIHWNLSVSGVFVFFSFSNHPFLLSQGSILNNIDREGSIVDPCGTPAIDSM